MPLYYYLYKLIYVLLPERSERLFLLISAMSIKLFNITKKERIMIKKSSRRRFLQLTAGGIIGLTLGNKLIIRSVHADELPHLEENNPQASTLKYVNNSKVKGQQCKNCLLIRNTSNDSDWQPCAIFPGKSVNMNGWCSAYAPKPA